MICGCQQDKETQPRDSPAAMLFPLQLSNTSANVSQIAFPRPDSHSSIYISNNCSHITLLKHILKSTRKPKFTQKYINYIYYIFIRTNFRIIFKFIDVKKIQ